MHLRRKWFLLAAFALTLIMVLAACAGSDDVATDNNGTEPDNDGVENANNDEGNANNEGTEDEATGEPIEGGDLILAMPADAVDMDPHGSNDVPSSQVQEHIYETLVEHDTNMELQPRLAESYEQLDEYTWEFNLHEGITFHDGSEFNAESVKMTLDRVLDPDFASEKAFLYNMIEEVEVVDDYTVHIHTEFPFAPLPAHLAHTGGGMISAQAIEEEEAGERNIATEPVGTGPFELESWDQGNEAVLVRNDDYWGDAAYLDSIIYREVPEQSTRIGMLDTGEAHVADQIEPANVAQVEAMEHAEFVTEESLRMDYISFNLEKEPFDDVRVRQALSMAIDNDAVVEGIYEGYGVAAKGPINSLIFGYHDDLDALGYDPEQAQELLAEAGYEDGFETTLWTNDANPSRMQMAEIVQDQLSEIGVEASIENIEWGAYLDQTAEGEHEMFVLGWTTVTGDGDYGMYSLFHTDNIGAPGNRAFYSNEEVDELLDAARQETDEEAREALYHEAQEILVEEAPMIYTVHEDYRVGVANSVEGLVLHPNGMFQLHEAYLTEDAEDVGY